MQKSFLLKVTLCLVLASLVFSCKKEPERADVIPVHASFDKATAQNWFEKTYASSLRTDAKNPHSYANTAPQWEQAIREQSSNKHPYLRIPLPYKRVKMVAYDPELGKNDPTKHPIELPAPQLLIYQDSKGAYQLQVMELIPDLAYLKKNMGMATGNNYTGVQLLKSWDGQPIKGFRYVNGKIVAKIMPKAANQRTDGTTCTTYVNAYFSNGCFDSSGNAVAFGTTVFTSLDDLPNAWPGFQPCCYNWCDGWSSNGYTIQYTECVNDGSGDGGSGGGDGSGDGFNPNPDAAFIGNKPILEYVNICDGIVDIWNSYPNNEVAGFTTRDGHFIMTHILPEGGGSFSGVIDYNGGTYYAYPMSQGAPAINYEGMTPSGGNYYIPVTAAVHTHSPCRRDGTNGVSHIRSEYDSAYFVKHPLIPHWAIGCDAIGQYNDVSANFFNVHTGALSTLCNTIR